MLVGASPDASGPSTVRGLCPWPTTVARRPGSQLAAPHAGQQAGRPAAHDGGELAQDLTPSSR